MSLCAQQTINFDPLILVSPTSSFSIRTVLILHELVAVSNQNDTVTYQK